MRTTIPGPVPRPGARRFARFAVLLASVLAFGPASRGVQTAEPQAASARASAGQGADAWVDDLSPIAAADWNADRAGHLLERAGFGGTPEDDRAPRRDDAAAGRRSLVDYEAVPNRRCKPFEESGVWDPGMDPFPPSRAEAVRIARERGEGLGEKMRPEGSQRRLQPVVDKFFYSLAANNIETQRLGLWWANRMLTTTAPLEEKLTLFWHGHFATGQNKMRDYRMMLQQNQMLRAQRRGRPARSSSSGILKDPGMLVYLDNGENVKSASERELRPRTARAVHDGRRQLHGTRRARGGARVHRLDQRRPRVQVRRRQHDFGEKTFLGQTGPFNGEEIIDIILTQPVTAEFVAGKIYRFFVREEISPAIKPELGGTFRDERLSDEAAAHRDLALRRTSTAAPRSRRKSRARCSSSCPRTASSACARCRRSPTSAA